MESIRNLDFFPSNAPPRPSGPGGKRIAAAFAVVLGGLLILGATLGRFEGVAQRVMVQFNRFAPVALADPDTLSERASAAQRRLRDLPMHPAVMYPDYLSGSVFSTTGADSALVREFHDLLDIYKKRQGVDDNFTIRVSDARDKSTLEVYTLNDLRRQWEQGRTFEWRQVDHQRRRHTRRLVDKWEDRGIPRDEIIVKWGRATQIEEAHERDQPLVEYEIRLAQYLGLSLLPTEIGTVETFNQDDLVSHVGARSRYQMMPWILRRSGVNTYTLRTDAGSWLRVREEHHPLLTLEPAFLLLRGYVNAVGHEIPGISAYHTGPGNIYKLYRLFFTHSEYFNTRSTVVDAYMWGVTKGFDEVRERSTFGPYSRGYIPSAYGALSAVDDRSVDPSQTLRTVRVQLEPGADLMLGDLLAVLDSTKQSFDWGPTAADAQGTYEKFRVLNPHVDLPPAADGEMPQTGNVRFVPSVDGKAVRFFLPLKAPAALRAAGMDVLDESASFRFDESTYALPRGERTRWDRAYDALVNDIKRFGFTPSNRDRLLTLHDQFVKLAEANPTHYRQAQLAIIRTHRRIWLSNPWEDLSEASMLATGRMRMRVQPPVALNTDSVAQAAARGGMR